ncbi:MAG: carbohydrate-binding family 9-like protein [Terriglobia bacterium]
MRITSPYTSNYVTASRRTARDFTPDGNIRKAVWKKAKWITFDHDWSGKRHYPQAETRVASLWTPQQFYLAYACKYTTLNIFEDGDPARDTIGLWNRDVVEVFVNPRPKDVNHYYEFEVAPNNLWVDLEINLGTQFQYHGTAAWNSGYQHATKIDAQRHIWTCEMRIPVGAVAGTGARLQVGAVWRINFYRADGQGNDSQRRFLAWSPTLGRKSNFHVPTRFGRVRFVA